MPSAEPASRLEDILEAIAAIEAYTLAKTQGEFGFQAAASFPGAYGSGLLQVAQLGPHVDLERAAKLDSDGHVA
jgi:hypothetical protein